MKRAIGITTALLCGICVADIAQDFRVPQGVTRENTGPLFWLHGTETEARLNSPPAAMTTRLNLMTSILKMSRLTKQSSPKRLTRWY